MSGSGDGHDRREFFRSSGRGIALGILGALAWAAGHRDREAREERCVGEGQCRGCRSIERCGLPRGISARETLQREEMYD